MKDIDDELKTQSRRLRELRKIVSAIHADLYQVESDLFWIKLRLHFKKLQQLFKRR